MKTKLYTTLLLCLLVTWANAQSDLQSWVADTTICYPETVKREIAALDYSPTGLLTFKVLGEDQEIPNLEIVSMFEDSRGDIWLGLMIGGVLRYNGRQLESFDDIDVLRGHMIMEISEDADGQLWFATFGGGLVRYDGKCFYTYNENSGFPGDHIMCLYLSPKGKMMAGLNGEGIIELERDGFKASSLNASLPNLKVWCLLEDSQDALWVGLVKAGLCRFEGLSMDVWSPESTDPLPDGTIRYLFEDSKGIIWAATNNGLVSFDQSSPEIILRNHPEFPKQIYEILEVSGKLWFGSNFNGVSILEGEELIHLGNAEGLVSERIKCLTKDRESNVWLGSLGGGLMCLEQWIFQNYHKENGVPESVSAISELNDGRVILASEGGGLYIKNGLNFQPYPSPSSLKQKNIWAILPLNNGALVLATDGQGVVELKGENLRFWNHQGNHGNRFLCLEQDDDGTIYAGGYDGLLKINPDGTTEHISHEELYGIELWDLYLDESGNLWIGTDGEGLWRYRPDSKAKQLEKVNSSEGLRAAVVNFIDADSKGQIWLALEAQGLGRIINSSDNQFRAERVNLPSIDKAQVYALQHDETGMWLGTSTGLMHITESENDFSIRKLERSDGIRSVQATSGRVLRDSKEHIWWPTEKYLLEYIPENEKGESILPLIHIEDVGLLQEKRTIWSKKVSEPTTFKKSSYWSSLWEDYIKIDSLDSWYYLPLGLSLSHEQNKISFHYLGSSWNNQGGIEYQHRLKNLEDEWADVGNDEKVEFNRIPPGNYVFEVRARDQSGVWSEPATFEFSITAPYWQTTWFIAIAVLVFIYLLFLLYKWRVRQLERDKEVLEEKVEQRTSELVEEKDKSERLLLNILPAETAEELKTFGTASTKNYEQASVLFSDFKGFTGLSESITPQELIETLDLYFQAFDETAEEYAVEKIKTIGDAYMCACGIPSSNPHHAVLLTGFGLHMLQLAAELNEERAESGEKPWNLRIGIHSGPLIAGVVGKMKIAYDIWGDTVNIASRMESSGEVNRVNVSAQTKALAEQYFEFSHRGEVAAKNKGMLDMYFVEGFKAEYADPSNNLLPSSKFFAALTKNMH